MWWCTRQKNRSHLKWGGQCVYKRTLCSCTPPLEYFFSVFVLSCQAKIEKMRQKTDSACNRPNPSVWKETSLLCHRRPGKDHLGGDFIAALIKSSAERHNIFGINIHVFDDGSVILFAHPTNATQEVCELCFMNPFSIFLTALISIISRNYSVNAWSFINNWVK